MFAETVVPIGVLTIVASMILPMPPMVLDFLLVGNLLLALLLFFSALYLTEPVKLSVLPTLLLLATMYRLSLNISSTRLILSGGDAGEVITAFGGLVTNGSLVVGAIVFLIITLVQFIVIAKGSERVAEVSARFVLDALPGKQMSIDADVRSGLSDFYMAQKKREDLQLESRFYGALDGAMKFVKGDAIAGMLMTGINVIGGLAIGIAVQGLEPQQALNRYTLLTIGDGLLSQLPALLNSLAAGMIVTRVSRENSPPFSRELFAQLGASSRVSLLVATVSLLLAAVPALPALPFLLFGMFLFVCCVGRTNERGDSPQTNASPPFVPRPTAVLELLLPSGYNGWISSRKGQQTLKNAIQKWTFERYGLVIAPPEFRLEESTNSTSVRVCLRGELYACMSEDQIENVSEVIELLCQLVCECSVELVDDVLTRRMLDCLESQAPELVNSVVPDVVSVTQITIIIRALIRDGIPVHSLDLILQAIAESPESDRHATLLLPRVRKALWRTINAKLAERGELKGYALSPELDLLLLHSVRGNGGVSDELLELLQQSILEEESVVLCSSVVRESVQEILRAQGKNNMVVSHEEVADMTRFVSLSVIEADARLDEIMRAA